jgi:hypothetical protein
MNPSPAPGPRSLPAFVLPGIVALAAFAAFSPALRADFVNWDDDLNFLNNPHYRGLGALPAPLDVDELLLGPLSPAHLDDPGPGLQHLGMNPLGYHLTNILIHAANAVLLYFVLAALCVSPDGPTPAGPPRAPRCSTRSTRCASNRSPGSPSGGTCSAGSSR